MLVSRVLFFHHEALLGQGEYDVLYPCLQSIHDLLPTLSECSQGTHNLNHLGLYYYHTNKLQPHFAKRLNSTNSQLLKKFNPTITFKLMKILLCLCTCVTATVVLPAIPVCWRCSTLSCFFSLDGLTVQFEMLMVMSQ